MGGGRGWCVDCSDGPSPTHGLVEAAANAPEEELTPEDLEQAELEAYAEELANQGSWDDPPTEHPSSDADMIHDMDMDVDMDF